MHELIDSLTDLCASYPETAHCTLTFLLAMVFTENSFFENCMAMILLSPLLVLKKAWQAVLAARSKTPGCHYPTSNTSNEVSNG